MHIEEFWQVPKADLKGIRLLVAYESVGDYGCDSSGFYVFRKGRKLYEVHGSHCSCYGFEGQWNPEETSLAYFRSDKFHFSTGGDDSEGGAQVAKVRDFFALKPRASKSGSLSAPLPVPDQMLANPVGHSLFEP